MQYSKEQKEEKHTTELQQLQTQDIMCKRVISTYATTNV